MVNITGLNGQILYNGNQNEITNRRSFLKKLAMDLMIKELAGRRENIRGLSGDIQETLARDQEKIEAELCCK